MISSFVFKALSFRLLRAAQAEVLLNSDWAVLRCLEPTRRLVSSANFIILLCGSIGCTCRSDATLTYDGDLLRTLNNTSDYCRYDGDDVPKHCTMTSALKVTESRGHISTSYPSFIHYLSIIYASINPSSIHHLLTIYPSSIHLYRSILDRLSRNNELRLR